MEQENGLEQRHAIQNDYNEFIDALPKDVLMAKWCISDPEIIICISQRLPTAYIRYIQQDTNTKRYTQILCEAKSKAAEKVPIWLDDLCFEINKLLKKNQDKFKGEDYYATVGD